MRIITLPSEEDSPDAASEDVIDLVTLASSILSPQATELLS